MTEKHVEIDSNFESRERNLENDLDFTIIVNNVIQEVANKKITKTEKINSKKKDIIFLILTVERQVFFY